MATTSANSSRRCLSSAQNTTKYLEIFIKKKISNKNSTCMISSRKCVRNAQNILGDHGLYIREFHCQDSVIYWRSQEIDRIKQIIEHGITNSIDHGYARPSQSNNQQCPIEISILAYGRGSCNLR